MNDNDFKNKYLKYKNKYFKYKNKYLNKEGGANVANRANIPARNNPAINNPATLYTAINTLFYSNKSLEYIVVHLQNFYTQFNNIDNIDNIDIQDNFLLYNMAFFIYNINLMNNTLTGIGML